MYYVRLDTMSIISIDYTYSCLCLIEADWLTSSRSYNPLRNPLLLYVQIRIAYEVPI